MSVRRPLFNVDPENYDISTYGYEAGALTSELRVRLIVVARSRIELLF